MPLNVPFFLLFHNQSLPGLELKQLHLGGNSLLEVWSPFFSSRWLCEMFFTEKIMQDLFSKSSHNNLANFIPFRFLAPGAAAIIGRYSGSDRRGQPARGTGS